VKPTIEKNKYLVMRIIMIKKPLIMRRTLRD